MSHQSYDCHPLLKYSSGRNTAYCSCALVWLYALIDQLYTSAGTMKYLLVSLIMIAIALIDMIPKSGTGYRIRSCSRKVSARSCLMISENPRSSRSSDRRFLAARGRRAAVEI